MERRTGLEPVTYTLATCHSTTELTTQKWLPRPGMIRNYNFQRVMCYPITLQGNKLAPTPRLEQGQRVLEALVLPLHYAGINWRP